MPRSITVAFVLLPALMGCSTYVYVAPSTIPYDPSSMEESDLVSYRTLSRGDFQAEELPAVYTSRQKYIVALTACVIRATPMLDAVEIPSNPDSSRWQVNVDDLWFETVMVRQQSWWNPKKNKEKDVRRILEHEQIHFAIFELQVRRANAQLEEIVRRIRVTGPTAMKALSRATKRFKAEHQRIMESTQAWNAKYDLETKNGTDSKVQKEWVEQIEKRLAVPATTDQAQ